MWKKLKREERSQQTYSEQDKIFILEEYGEEFFFMSDWTP